ncbi:archaeosortase/exosortase family protein [Candidatus Bathyarchaeota archaeon]|nr:archaeosortase/exosortase family protein [Candidatus Bathyarchaeota archaeon]MBL7079958.1 archaeosortase/exosortase family protein [Candidatus Bathyarchaeota archaeon]
MKRSVKSGADSSVYRRLIFFTVFALVVLPFTTSFNEALTKMVERLEIVSAIQSSVAPLTVRGVTGILGFLGIPCVASGSSVYLTEAWMPLAIYVNWNCIGWQSVILLALTFVTGLQGDYTFRSKMLVVVLGLEGTLIVNIVRIVIPTLLAYGFGRLPAIFFHDYIGALITLIWLSSFWYFAFNRILVKDGGG